MLNQITNKLRAIAHRQLEGGGAGHPVAQRVREVANTINDLLGRPIRGDDGAAHDGQGATAAASSVTARAPEQAPVILYFDGKDHRTKAKVEELLRGRDITFRVLDVGDDEVERSWITTAAKRDEFPIVVIAGTPVGGLHELTQLDVQGELKRRVFGAA